MGTTILFMRVLVLATICGLLCLTPIAHAAQGRAVFYKPPYTPSACFGGRNMGRLVAGVSDALWGNGRACGRRYRVRCVGGTNETPHPCKYGRSVVVTVVDYCRQPCNGILNLSLDAFAAIANPEAGNVNVQFA